MKSWVASFFPFRQRDTSEVLTDVLTAYAAWVIPKVLNSSVNSLPSAATCGTSPRSTAEELADPRAISSTP